MTGDLIRCAEDGRERLPILTEEVPYAGLDVDALSAHSYRHETFEDLKGSILTECEDHGDPRDLAAAQRPTYTGPRRWWKASAIDLSARRPERAA